MRLRTAGRAFPRVAAFTGMICEKGDLAGRDRDRIALGFERDFEAEGAGEQGGIERLNRVRINRAGLRRSLEQGLDGMRDAGVEAGRDDAESHALPFPDRIYSERAAARH